MNAPMYEAPSAPTSNLLERLEEIEQIAAGHLRELSGDDLVDAWWCATDDLAGRLPPDLRRRMAEAAGLSAQGLEAGLDVVARGVRTEAARRLLAHTPRPAEPLRPALVVLASNLPGLALQCLLPALAARRPLLLKTPTAEPHFTPWLLRRLAAAGPGSEPALETAFAAATWRGGDRTVEDLVLPRVERVIAYGGDGAILDLAARARSTAEPLDLVGHGHRISVGIVLASADLDTLDLEETARGLARDVALFDQRGCLSVHSVLVASSGGEGAAEPAEVLARALAANLARLAETLPPGPASAGRLAAVRAAREEAVMAGHRVFDLPLRQGTVVLDCSQKESGEGPARLQGPGLRTVRVVPCASRRALLETLEPWRGRLQGVALAGSDSSDGSGSSGGRGLEDELRALGVTRVAPTGRLQEVDAATWRNGGRTPLAAYSGAGPDIA